MFTSALPVDDVVVFFLSSLSVNAAFSAGTVCSAVRVGRKFLNTHTKIRYGCFGGRVPCGERDGEDNTKFQPR